MSMTKARKRDLRTDFGRGFALLAAFSLVLAGCDSSSTTPSPATTSTPSSTLVRPDDLPGAFREALREADTFTRLTRIAALFEVATPEDTDAITAVFKDPKVVPTVTDTTILLAWWARRDPASAFDWLKEELSAFEASTYQVVFEEWGRVDPMGAAQVLSAGRSLDSAVMELASAALLRGWHRSEQPGIDYYIFSIREPGLSGFLLDSHTRYLAAAEGPEYVMNWVDGVADEDEQFKLSVVRVSSSSIARVSPEYGLKMWDKYKDTPFANNLVKRIGIGWIENTDGADVLEWAMPLASDPLQKGSIAAIMRRWGRLDREAAMAWMAEQTKSSTVPKVLQPALFIYAAWVGPVDGPRALELVDKLDDENRKRIMTVRIVRDWHRYDPEAAREWIETSGVDSKQREKIEKAIETGKLP